MFTPSPPSRRLASTGRWPPVFSSPHVAMQVFGGWLYDYYGFVRFPLAASLHLPTSLSSSRPLLSCEHRGGPPRVRDKTLCCTTTSSTRSAYVEFLGLRDCRFPHPPHVPARGSLRAWLAAPHPPSFGSLVGHELPVAPDFAGRGSCFPRTPLDFASSSLLSW